MKTELESQTTDDDVPDLRRRRLLFPLSATASAAMAEPEAVSVSATPPEAITPPPAHQQLAEQIRACAAEGAVLERQTLLASPDAPSQAELDALLAQIGLDDRCQDIAHIEQQANCYYYSDRYMSHNYARILVFTHEQDACATLAQSVRFECETYPRPFKLDMLALPPYDFDEDKIASTLRFLTQSDAYDDIHPVVASNGAVYLYSDRFMRVGKAQGLCEWIEVEQYENP